MSDRAEMLLAPFKPVARDRPRHSDDPELLDCVTAATSVGMRWLDEGRLAEALQ